MFGEIPKEELHAMLAMYAIAVTEHERRKKARRKARKRRERLHKRYRYSKKALQRIERALMAHKLSKGWHRRMPDNR